MVNYHNPVTIENDACAYASLPGISGLKPDLPVCPFDSGAHEVVAPYVWNVYVSLPVLPRWPLLGW